MAKKCQPSAADRKRVEKLAVIVDDLRAGKDFSITRLTSVKSLCKDHAVACKFTCWLASLAAETIAARKRRPSHIGQEQWNEIRGLAAEGLAALKERKSTKQLWEILSRVRGVQNETERRHWVMVRMICSSELLQIERALECRLNPLNASNIAYDAARLYAERYDPRYGTGLIPASAAPLQEIVSYFERCD